MGRTLRDLHGARKQADYDLDVEKYETPIHAQACVKRTEQLLAKIAVIGQTPTKQQLIAGLTQYKKLRQGLS